MRFAQAIQARFGVRYDPDHVGRIMHRLGLRERRRTHRRVPEVIYATRYILPEVTSVA
jgi:transposase